MKNKKDRKLKYNVPAAASLFVWAFIVYDSVDVYPCMNARLHADAMCTTVCAHVCVRVGPV